VVNKWDEVAGHKGQKRNEFEEKVRYAFKFLEYAQIAFASAKTGASPPRSSPRVACAPGA